MAAPITDPYKTLGVSPGVSDAELRAAYRRLVQQHHPDHNRGSAESARRFEEIQEAYGRVTALRASGRSSTASGPATGPRAAGPPPRTRPRPAEPRPNPDADPAVESKLADLERELREAHAASERARREAREAHAASERARREAREAAAEATGRPSDEELGYVRTDDSFGKILADAGAELADRLSHASERLSDEADKAGVAKRVSDLLEELDHLSSKLTGDSKRKGD